MRPVWGRNHCASARPPLAANVTLANEKTPRCRECRTGNWSVTLTTATLVASITATSGTQCPVPDQCHSTVWHWVPSAGPVSSFRLALQCNSATVPHRNGHRRSKFKVKKRRLCTETCLLGLKWLQTGSQVRLERFSSSFPPKSQQNVVKAGVSDTLGVVVSDRIVALDGQCLASASRSLALQCNSASQCPAFSWHSGAQCRQIRLKRSTSVQCQRHSLHRGHGQGRTGREKGCSSPHRCYAPF